MQKIISYLTNRPLVTHLLVALVVIAAIASAAKIKRLGFPRVDLGKLFIETIYPGASPSDVELNVTKTIEDSLKEVDGIEYFNSISMENRSRIHVILDQDAEDFQIIKDDIRRALDRITDFPNEVKDRPIIFEEKIDNFPIYEIAIYSKKDNNSKALAGTQLLRSQAKSLKKQLLKVPGVGRVGEQGIPDPEIKILLNKNQMAKHQVSFNEVLRSIKQNKLRVTGGSLESYTTEKGIVTLSEFKNPKSIGEIIVRSSIKDDYVRLKDVANIKQDFEKLDILVRNNQHPGMTLFIIKKGDADIISSVDEIKAVVKDFKENRLAKNVDIVTMFDQALDTKNRLNMLYQNSIIGFFLVLIVLLLFLDPKVAFWTTVGIPLAISIALIAMPFFDMTINSVSLIGMVVVLGMVVDDAIIIADAIYGAKEEGLIGLDAALAGIKKVFYPVMATIATTIIAFTPMYFLPGEEGKFSIEIPSVVIIMLLGSFIEATTILPAHLAHSNPISKSRRPPAFFIIAGIQKYYRILLAKSLKHEFISLLTLTVLLIAGGALANKLATFKMFPIDDAYILSIFGETSPNSRIEYTYDQTKTIEKIIMNHPQAKKIISSLKTQIGIRSPYANQGGNTIPNSFTTRIIMTPANTRKITAEELKRYILSKTNKMAIKEDLKLDYYIDGGGPPQGKPLEINVTSNDNSLRLRLAKRIMKELKKLPLTEIDADLREGKEEVHLIPNYEAVAQAGLHVSNIAATIRTAFDGDVVTHLTTAEDRIPFRVMLEEDAKGFSKPLEGLVVSNPRGAQISLSKLVTATNGISPKTIHHRDGYRNTKITANIDLSKTTPTEVNTTLTPWLNSLAIEHPNAEISIDGEAKKDSHTIRNLMWAIAAAIIAVYFLMVVQFNSFTQPGMVLMGIPFGLVGIMIAFGLHDENLSMLALIGILGFAGVVVNDSLIMVEYINRFKPKGNDPQQDFSTHILDGATQRLRPIFLTTISTVAGLLPTAYGWVGGFDSFISPMVLAMTWGLVVGTTSILFVIPILYQINAKTVRLFRRLFTRN